MVSPDDDALRRALERVLGAVGVDAPVEDLARLTGGASRETFRFSVGGADHILQRERPGVPHRPQSMASEAEVVRAAGRVGVRVPEVVASNADDADTAIGSSFFITRAVEGETIARRILRDDAFAGARTKLASQFGEALALIHQIDPEPFPWFDRDDELDKYRLARDELELQRPAFELAFRWLEQHRPAAAPPTFVHGDFRLGNMIIDQHGLAAVIDWELVHISDPMEDLAWLCVRAWRFGGARPVAGLGTYDALLDGYERVAGAPVDRSALRWWEILGSLKWGIMCGRQAAVHMSGAYRSVELAAIGRRIVEQEQDVLALIESTEAGGVA